MACLDHNISSKELHTEEYIQEKSCGYIDDAVDKHYLGKGILNENFRQLPKKFVNIMH